MARLQRRRFSESSDVRSFPHGKVEVVELDDRAVGRLTYEPGWRWSVDVRPIASTQSCQFHHVGVTVSGRLRVLMQDGVELEIGAGDVFEIPPGHDAWVVGDEPWISIDFEAMRSFGRATGDNSRRVLSTIVITDIVDSTTRAHAVGPARWREIVSQHNEISERIIDAYHGRLVKTTGDGVIGLFDSSERAIRAALQLSDAIAALDIAIRAAVHSGEIEIQANDIRGVAVHTAARMMTVAGPGDVIVSSTVRELLDDSDVALEDFGTHQLKGLPGQRQLFRVVARRGRSVPPAAAH
ncbi:MAG TPA: adenylate/guanylate cyclase domain-containing protein [Candidatus Limnocylindrales bacterium]|nr:adenylate/guanylate cyclase domain-containing protein [Candidatus Limnocylindrales bacterium]